MTLENSALLATLRQRKATATAARTLVETELSALNDQLAATADAMEIERLTRRKLEVQARIDTQATAEEEASTALEAEELRATAVIKDVVTIRRSTFNAMTPQEQMAHAKAGGRVDDPPKTMRSPAPLPAKGIRRAAFDQLRPIGTHGSCHRGRRYRRLNLISAAPDERT